MQLFVWWKQRKSRFPSSGSGGPRQATELTITRMPHWKWIHGTLPPRYRLFQYYRHIPMCLKLKSYVSWTMRSSLYSVRQRIKKKNKEGQWQRSNNMYIPLLYR
uniref:Uncharacterized protein n=1 Tax=Anopheles quadriannulatus TaxID=34691 RepID=A0A182XSY7_ANOQN